MSRFSANASKAKQATSRARQLEKIQLEEVKPSSRQNPYLVFHQERKLYRNALDGKDLSKSFGDLRLFHKMRLHVEAGERLAIIGSNGLGKTTLLRCLVGELTPDAGEIKWAENARIGYFAQDYAPEFAEDMTLFDWKASLLQAGFSLTDGRGKSPAWPWRHWRRSDSQSLATRPSSPFSCHCRRAIDPAPGLKPAYIHHNCRDKCVTRHNPGQPCGYRRYSENDDHGKDLSKSFGDLRLFHKLRLHVEAGERVAIIGSNGLGKTTLLLIGIWKPFYRKK